MNSVTAGDQPHDCGEHLRFRAAEAVETHGLDAGPFERFWEEWYECRICHEVYTPDEAAQLNGAQ